MYRILRTEIVRGEFAQNCMRTKLLYSGSHIVNQKTEELTNTGLELAGSLPIFPGRPGSEVTSSMPLPDFTQKRLIFNDFSTPGEVHVYSAYCRAGDRLRVQALIPVLPWGGATVPSFAVVAQSLPYSNRVQELPMELPAGFSAVVAPAAQALGTSVQDVLTRVKYHPGPVIDTRTLVGGRCYIVVWNPTNGLGKYVLQAGARWSLRWQYWAQLPRFWWQIRGWFGLSRMGAAVSAAGLLLLTLLLFTLLRNPQNPSGRD